MKALIIMMLLGCYWAAPLWAQDPPAGFREDFATLTDWKPLTFPKNPRHSTYAVKAVGDSTVLVAKADASASGIIHQRTFNIYETPIIRWRWKVSNIFQKGDEKTKSGDDYPLRIYIVFEYDPQQAGVLDKARYSAARLIYGQYPPHSSLNYIWANKTYSERILPNPYTGRAQMVLLQKGDEHVGQWMEERVNALADYRKAFGEDPPVRAALAIMADADNTGEKAKGYVEYIEVSAP